MTDDTQGVQQPVNETQDTATPTVEQQTTESQKVSGNGLPNEASERTKESFERLTSELAEERRRRQALEDAYSTLKPKQTVQPETTQPIYDPETGLLNEQALTTVQQRAEQAEREAHKTREELNKYLEERKQEAYEKEDQEAYAAHPELNPKNKDVFNKELRDVTAAIKLQSMLHPEDFGNRQLSHKEAGDKAKELIAKISGNVKQEAAQEAIEQLSPKEQAALEATGSNARVHDSQTRESLKQATRKGDVNAIMQRLKNIQSQ